jgi:hypothetical protein
MVEILEYNNCYCLLNKRIMFLFFQFNKLRKKEPFLLTYPWIVVKVNRTMNCHLWDKNVKFASRICWIKFLYFLNLINYKQKRSGLSFGFKDCTFWKWIRNTKCLFLYNYFDRCWISKPIFFKYLKNDLFYKCTISFCKFKFNGHPANLKLGLFQFDILL